MRKIEGIEDLRQGDIAIILNEEENWGVHFVVIEKENELRLMDLSCFDVHNIDYLDKFTWAVWRMNEEKERTEYVVFNSKKGTKIIPTGWSLTIR